MGLLDSITQIAGQALVVGRVDGDGAGGRKGQVVIARDGVGNDAAVGAFDDGAVEALVDAAPRAYAFFDQHARGDCHVERLDRAGFVIEKVCPRHDRMARWFGAMFGFGTRYLPSFTASIVRHYLPKVAALPWQWHEGSDFSPAPEATGASMGTNNTGRRDRCIR